jgi:hypothetical protein
VTDPQALHTALLAEVHRQDPYGLLKGWIAVKVVLELHKPISDDLWTSEGKRLGWQCEECASRCHSGSGLNCDEPLDAEYPCDTVEVIAAALGVTTDG